MMFWWSYDQDDLVIIWWSLPSKPCIWKHGRKTSFIFRDKEAKHCPLHHNSQVTIPGITRLLICVTGFLVLTWFMISTLLLAPLLSEGRSCLFTQLVACHDQRFMISTLLPLLFFLLESITYLQNWFACHGHRFMILPPIASLSFSGISLVPKLDYTLLCNLWPFWLFCVHWQ